MRSLTLWLVIIGTLGLWGQRPAAMAQLSVSISTPKVDTDGGLGHHITDFRCYISALHLTIGEKRVWTEVQSYHLIDMADSASLSIALGIPQGLQYDGLHLLLGIDSLTSVSGAFGGDLDPTNGMYWAWNSGYIHWKIAGVQQLEYGQELPFEYHLGGYLPPTATARPLSFACSEVDGSTLHIDLARFLQGIDIAETPRVMSPGQRACRLSQSAAQCIRLRP